MKQRPRIYYTESQKALMWDRWKAGDSLQKIAQLFDRNHSSIQRILAETGGIRPASRRRSRLSLTLVEREEISRALAVGQSIRQIALRLERAPSTISREISRNGGRRSYRANEAEQAAWDRAHRPKLCKLAQCPKLAQLVAEKLQIQWFPPADRWMVEANIPGRGQSGVTRDHLPEPLHPGPWRIEEGITGASAPQPGHAPLTPSHPENRQPWPHQRYDFHQRTASLR